MVMAVALGNSPVFIDNRRQAKVRRHGVFLRHFASLDPVPWACMGDFNEILHQSKNVSIQKM